MLVRKSKEQRMYFVRLKNEISTFTFNYKKRYSLFPYKEIRKISKYKFDNQTTILVGGVKFNIREAIRELEKTYKKSRGKASPSYFNFVLRAYTKDSINKEGKDLKAVYQQYHQVLQSEFKGMTDDLRFCLTVLKELNKAMKNDYTKESAKTDDIYEEGMRDIANKVGDKALKYAKPMNEAINRGTDKVARKVIKKPKEGSPSHVYDDYEKKVRNLRATLKVATLATAEAGIFVIPIPGSSAMYNAIIAAGIKASNDPVDTMVQDKLISLKNKVNSLKSNVTSFFNKNNNKKFKSAEEAKKEFYALDSKAALVAKQIDALNNSGKMAVAESANLMFESVFDMVIENSENLSIDCYEAVNNAIHELDITNINDMLLCEVALDIIIKDSGINESADEKLSVNQTCLKDFTNYVKGCKQDCVAEYADIKPLSKPMIHKTKKHGDWLILAKYYSDQNKESCKKFLQGLNENVKYNGEDVEFHTCYLPGDMFIYIELPKKEEK